MRARRRGRPDVDPRRCGDRTRRLSERTVVCTVDQFALRSRPRSLAPVSVGPLLYTDFALRQVAYFTPPLTFA